MAVIEGPPPDESSLGMTREERLLANRPLVVIYFQRGKEVPAKNIAARIRAQSAEDGTKPRTTLCDISRWDGADYESAAAVFVMRGPRESELTRLYRRYVPGCDIFYLDQNGEPLPDVRPEDVSASSNPVASFLASAAARKEATQDVDPPENPQGSRTPADGQPALDPADSSAKPGVDGGEESDLDGSGGK